ncbi:MAG: 16S rRNA (cytidine(1402)-2'-O)-methyltransferase [Blastomonas sp.]
MTHDLEPGLYIVATPIGNLGDLTQRAIEVLGRADHVACEDSRVTGKLLHRLNLKKPMLRYNDHSKAQDRERIIALAQTGIVALVSDAGTPLISDPGYKLVRDAQQAGIAITSLPGASAAIVALTLSGLPTDRFYFHGFLPARPAARSREAETLSAIAATLIFYESGPRLGACLADLAALWPDREAAVVREISKKFEEVRTGSLAELAAQYGGDAPRGEIVLLVGPPGAPEAPDEAAIDAMLAEALRDHAPSQAAALVARQTGADRKQLYRRAMDMKSGHDGE